MLWTKGKLCYIFCGSILVHHNYIMLSENNISQWWISLDFGHLYPPAPGWPSGIVIMGSMDITIPGWRKICVMHPYLHSHLYDCVYVLSQFQSRLSTIVVTQHTKAVPIPKWSVFQETHLSKHLIELRSNIATPCHHIFLVSAEM